MPWFLVAVLISGLALRLWLLHSPFGEVEADESVVGLMALHVLQGERPVFYWGQPYLGSLEAYLVASVFAVAPPSNLLLKLVPTVVFFVFVVLAYSGARRDLGLGPALLTALYYCLPGSFLLFWSTKARGGYVELLALGQALIFLAPWAARRGPRLDGRLALYGFLAGLALWTHTLGLAWVVPAAIYSATRLGKRLLGAPLLAAVAGGLIGLGPAIAENVRTGGQTLEALQGGGSSGEVAQENFRKLVDVGLPVLAGLGQATSSPALFAQDWPQRPGSWPWSGALLLGLGMLLLAPWARALLAPFQRGLAAERLSTAYFGLTVSLLTAILAVLGRFGELVAEPRYALGLYVAAPLIFGTLWTIGRRRWPLLVASLAAILGLNLFSLVTADPRLNLPTTAGDSNQRTRQRLIEYLEGQGIQSIYADYWIAYPVIFESGERIVASVSSGGYNRYLAYAHLVSIDPEPAFVFVRGSLEEAAFRRQLSSAGGRAGEHDVSIYRVYLRAQPLGRLRPP